ncbi:MAG: hypoxanthine phosphoribosyltransferase [Catalinimonas sp.]
MSQNASAVTLHDRIFVPYVGTEELESHVAALAERITTDYAGKNPLFVVVLNGAFFFAAELLKRVATDCEVTFVKLASYQGTESTGKVTEVMGLSEELSGRHVIAVEDIVDTGLTLHGLLESLQKHGPASLAVATLLLKPRALRHPVVLDYVGLKIDDRFVVGWGLDYDGLGRNLPQLYQEST